MSLAVAYAMKNKAKKMAMGGMSTKECAEHGMADCGHCMADGGMAEDDGDLVGRIMKARGTSMGDRMDDDTPVEADFEPADYEAHDDLEADYARPNDGPGDMQEDDDRRDVVERIMRSRRMKDRNPRPA